MLKKVILIVGIGFILFLSNCSEPEKIEILTGKATIQIYIGSSEFTASPKVIWYTNDVKLKEEYLPTSAIGSDIYIYTDYTYKWERYTYPDEYANVYFYNAFGTVLKTFKEEFTFITTNENDIGYDTNTIFPYL